jgi:membrane protease subunit HflK
MYLETMERVLGGSNKFIIDSSPGGQGVVPYLPLNEINPPPAATPRTQSGAQR